MERFENGLSNWIVEQTPEGTTEIKNGMLEINGGGCTVWLKRRLQGPVVIEYEATLVVEGGPNDNCRDLNCFWMASNPREPADLFTGRTSSSVSRAGVFARYHDLQAYYVGCGGNNNTTSRFRRYAGDGDRPLREEHSLTDSQYLLEPNRCYRIRVEANGSNIRWLRDGRVFFNFDDPDPYTSGWFGFRTVSSHIRIDNVVIYSMGPRLSPVAAVPSQ